MNTLTKLQTRVLHQLLRGLAAHCCTKSAYASGMHLKDIRAGILALQMPVKPTQELLEIVSRLSTSKIKSQVPKLSDNSIVKDLIEWIKVRAGLDLGGLFKTHDRIITGAIVFFLTKPDIPLKTFYQLLDNAQIAPGFTHRFCPLTRQYIAFNKKALSKKDLEYSMWQKQTLKEAANRYQVIPNVLTNKDEPWPWRARYFINYLNYQGSTKYAKLALYYLQDCNATMKFLRTPADKMGTINGYLPDETINILRWMRIRLVNYKGERLWKSIEGYNQKSLFFYYKDRDTVFLMVRDNSEAFMKIPYEFAAVYPLQTKTKY